MTARTLHVPVPPIPGAALVAAGTLAAVVAGAPLGAALLLAGFAPAVGAALVDRAEGRIPDLLVALVAVVPLALMVTGALPAGHLLLGAALAAAPLLAVHLAVPAAMGFGDVKLAAALGALLAGLDARAGVVAVAVGAVVTIVGALVTRRRAVPFAPGLVGGAASVTGVLLALGWEAPRWP